MALTGEIGIIKDSNVAEVSVEATVNQGKTTEVKNEDNEVKQAEMKVSISKEEGMKQEGLQIGLKYDANEKDELEDKVEEQAVKFQGSLDLKGDNLIHAELSKKKSGGKTMAKTIGTAAAVGLGTATGVLPAALLVAGGVGVLNRSSSSEGKTSPTSKPGSPMLAAQFSGISKDLARNNAAQIEKKEEQVTVQAQLEQDKSVTSKPELKHVVRTNDEGQETKVVTKENQDDAKKDETMNKEKVEKMIIQRRGEATEDNNKTDSDLAKQRSEDKVEIKTDASTEEGTEEETVTMAASASLGISGKVELLASSTPTEENVSSTSKPNSLITTTSLEANKEYRSFSMQDEVTVIRQEVRSSIPEYERSQSKTDRVKKKLGGLDKKIKDSKLKQECKDVGRELGNLAKETKRGGVDRLLKRNKH